MAEVLGVVSGAAGVVSLSLQILESVKKLYEFCNAVKGAPKEIHAVLQEIVILAEVLAEMSDHESGVPELNHRAIRQCEMALADINRVVTELDTGIRKGSTQQRRYWSVLSVLKERKLESFLRRLERSKSTLVLAQICYMQSFQCRRKKQETNQNAAIEPTSLSASTDQNALPTTKPLSTDRRPLQSKRTLWLGLGTLKLQSSSDSNTEEDGRDFGIEFHFAPWFLNLGISIASKREFGGLGLTLRPLHYVDGSSPIVQACQYGDDAEVQRLFMERKASPYDNTIEGYSLLYIAAMNGHPDTCSLLLGQGAPNPTIIEGGGCLPPVIGACIWSHRSWAGGDGDEHVKRSDLAVQTFNILSKPDRVEVEENFKVSGYCDYLTPLHFFQGLRHDFLKLLDSYGPRSPDTRLMDHWYSSVMLIQAEMAGTHPANSFFVCMERIVNWNIPISICDNIGRTMLHNLLRMMHADRYQTASGSNSILFSAIQNVVQQGADVCAVTTLDCTPLVVATFRGLIYLIECTVEMPSEEIEEIEKRCTDFWNARIQSWVDLLQNHSSFRNQLDRYVDKELELSGQELPILHALHDGCDRIWYCRINFESRSRQDEEGIMICDQLDVDIEFWWEAAGPKKMPGGWIEEGSGVYEAQQTDYESETHDESDDMA